MATFDSGHGAILKIEIIDGKIIFNIGEDTFSKGEKNEYVSTKYFAYYEGTYFALKYFIEHIKYSPETLLPYLPEDSGVIHNDFISEATHILNYINKLYLISYSAGDNYCLVKLLNEFNSNKWAQYFTYLSSVEKYSIIERWLNKIEEYDYQYELKSYCPPEFYYGPYFNSFDSIDYFKFFKDKIATKNSELFSIISEEEKTYITQRAFLKKKYKHLSKNKHIKINIEFNYLVKETFIINSQVKIILKRKLCESIVDKINNFVGFVIPPDVHILRLCS